MTITLTDAQVALVVSEASNDQGLIGILARLGEPRDVQNAMIPILDDGRYSHSLCRAMLTLAAFPADGGKRPLIEVARELGMSPSTTHRYIRTLVALGLLEQDAQSRRYSRQSRRYSQLQGPPRAAKAKSRRQAGRDGA